jgi:hypothetical protein
VGEHHAYNTFLSSPIRGDLSALLIEEISLWANFATHFGAMSAALAAQNTTQIASDVSGTVADMSDTIEDIHTVTTRVDDILPPVV